jgi:hypothetical protein
MLDQLTSHMPDSQLLRELIHNALHALLRLLVTDPARRCLHVIAVDRNGVPKLAVLDTGIGMSGAQGVAYIGDLSASLVVDKDRFGIGSNAAGFKASPEGLEYVTWDGQSDPVRIMFYDTGTEVGLAPIGPNGSPIQVISIEELPFEIQAAGHGTLVVVHGHSPQEDTYRTMLNAVAKGNLKGYTRYLNERYQSLPAGIEIRLRALRSKSKSPIGHSKDFDDRSTGNEGMRAACESVATLEGLYEGDGWRVRWYVVPGNEQRTGDAKSGKRTYDHGDTCWNRGIVAVSVPDAELPGLWENYEFFIGPSAKAKIANFGLAPIMGNISLLIELTDPKRLGIGANQARTMLETADGKQLDIHPMASEFRANMPIELQELIEESVTSRSIDLTDAFASLLEDNPELFDIQRLMDNTFGPGAKGATDKPDKDDDTDDDPDDDDPEDDTADKSKDKSPKTPDDGDGQTTDKSGGRGAKKDGAGKPGSIKPPAVLDWVDPDPEYHMCFAFWDEANYAILINDDCPEIDRETDWHIANRSDADRLTDTDRISVRKVVRDVMAITAIEALARNLQRQAVETDETFRQSWDFALTPQGLTHAASASIMRRMEVGKRISARIGSDRR